MAEANIGDKTFLIPDKGSPCDLWRTYFDHLKRETGRENARNIWLLTWAQNGSASCTTNSDFNRWLSRNGIDVSNAATRAVADVGKIGSNILGLGKNLTKMLSVGIPIASGVLLIIVVIILVRKARTLAEKIPTP